MITKTFSFQITSGLSCLTALLSVPDFLNCKCFLSLFNTCNQDSTALTLYKSTLNALYIPGMEQYSTNWLNCMTCSEYRTCIASNTQTNALRSQIITKYKALGFACPDAYLYQLVKAAAVVFPKSPFVQYANTIESCLAQYKTAMPNALQCFSTANSLFNLVPLPTWAPLKNLFGNFTTGTLVANLGNASQIVNSVIFDPVSF